MNNEIFSFDYCGRIVSFNISDNEDYIQKQIIKSNNFYEIDLLEEISRLPVGDGAFVDVGANIGNHTVYFSSILKRDVYSFEPIKACHDQLIKNVLANGSYERVKVFNTAIGSKRDVGFMSINKENIGASRFSISGAGDVPIAPLDDYIEDCGKIALIKIDVEGYESEVIKGASKVITDNRPLVIAETQNQMDFINVSEVLKELDYLPIGLKGATRTVFFVPEEKFSDYNNHIWFLIRNDIEQASRIIIQQNTKISNCAFSIKDNLEINNKDIIDSIRGLEEQAQAQDNSIVDGMSLVRESMDSNSDKSDAIIDSIRGLEEQAKDNSIVDDMALVREGIESNSDKSDAIIGSIIGLEEQAKDNSIVDDMALVREGIESNSDKSDAIIGSIIGLEEQAQAQDNSIVDGMSLVRESMESNSDKSDAIIDSIRGLEEQAKDNSIVDDMALVREIIESNSDKSDAIIGSISDLSNIVKGIEDKLISNQEDKKAERDRKILSKVKTINDTINSISEENHRLHSKVEIIYGSYSWRVTSFIRSLFGFSTQKYDVFRKNISDKYKNEEKSMESNIAFRELKDIVGSRITKMRNNVLKDKGESIYPSYMEKGNFKKTDLSLFSFPKVSIIMTSYNTEDLISAAIDSILNQNYGNIELIIVDDCSTDGSRDIILDYARKNNNIKAICFGENRGTYWCKNYGITKATGEIITFMDSDDVSMDTRIQEQYNALNSSKVSMVTVNMNRVDEEGKLILINGHSERIAPISKMVRRSIFDTIGFFDTTRTSADDEFMQRVKLVFGRKTVVNINKPLYIALVRDDSLTMEAGNKIDLTKKRKKGESFLPPARQSYLNNYQKWHKSVQDRKNIPFVTFPVVERPFEVTGKLVVAGGIYNDNIISVCLASFPERIKQLEKVIKDMLPQADRIYVYLNEYTYIPSFLINEKITVQLGINASGDMRDNGKFYFMNKISSGYCFTIDDDINYPADYIQQHIRKIEIYNRKVITGIHGTIFAKPFVSYFENRNVLHFKESLDRDEIVNQLGTGTIGFHTSLMVPDVSGFVDTGMVDVFLALLSHEKNIPLICIERKSAWLTAMPSEESDVNLFSEFSKAAKKQTEYIKGICPLSEGFSGEIKVEMDKKVEKYGEMFYSQVASYK